MTLDNVVQVVLDKGKVESDAIVAEARAEHDRMLAEVRAEAAKALGDAEERARQTAERRRVQELARAELEARKIALAAQKEVLDEVYQRTLARLANLSDGESLLRQLLKTNQAEWKAGGKVYASPKDQSVVRGIVGSAYAGTTDCVGGVIIESADGSRRTDLRYESLLRDVWDDSVREIAEILWPSRVSKA